MSETANTEPIYVELGESSFYMESAVYSGETKVAETELLTGTIYRAIVGSQPAVITLEGRILPDEKSYFISLIKDNLGKSVASLSVNGDSYSEMVLTKGNVTFSDKSFTGKCVMVFKSL